MWNSESSFKWQEIKIILSHGTLELNSANIPVHIWSQTECELPRSDDHEEKQQTELDSDPLLD